MSWEELGELVEEGWEIGSHTRTHPRLPTLDAPALLRRARRLARRVRGPPRRLPVDRLSVRRLLRARRGGRGRGRVRGRRGDGGSGAGPWPAGVAAGADLPRRRRRTVSAQGLALDPVAAHDARSGAPVWRCVASRREHVVAGDHRRDGSLRLDPAAPAPRPPRPARMAVDLQRGLPGADVALVWPRGSTACRCPTGCGTLRAFPKPFEAYRFWEHYLPGFSRRDRPPTAADVPEAGIAPVRRATARILRFQRRPRLLVKVTGWSRIAYFDRIYPDAVFVSLTRDPRSVVSSWIKAGWLDVTSPPDSPDWQWGEVPAARPDRLARAGGRPAALRGAEDPARRRRHRRQRRAASRSASASSPTRS